MTKNRLQLVIALAIAAVLLVGGFFLGVQPQLAAAASNRTQQRSIEATNQTYRAELSRLAAQAGKLPAMRREAAALVASIPSSANTAAFYKEVGAIASNTGVTISGITTSYATAYTPPAAATGASGGTTSEPTGTTTPSPSASATAAAPSAVVPTGPAPFTDPKITAANFSTIAVSIGITGSFDQALAFTKGVQSGRRLFLVDDVKSETADSSALDGSAAASGATSWTLSGFIYVLSDAASAQASQGSASATATATATPANG